MIKSITSHLLVVLMLVVSCVASAAESNSPVWYGKDSHGQSIVHLYFFWSEKCPHCMDARPDILEIDVNYPWLKLHSYELSKNKENVQIYISMAASFGNDARSVPTFMFCGNLLSGYDSHQTTGESLREHLEACYQFVRETNPKPTASFDYNSQKSDSSSVEIPFIGVLSADDYSLPVLTILIAGMDAFNPCAFFVLLFLLSMMVHSSSRGRMVLIGGIFVFFSGAMYFLFMAAWLNLFVYIGELRLITLIAGSLAVLIALINIKDYFWFKKGISLSISNEKKPALFDRVRHLLRLESLFTAAVATVFLAIVANSYELLCTAGFPMIYTRILTLSSMSTTSYYFYLLLYNLVYILPLLVIVVLFTIKLGSRKLTRHEGVVLKLLSGVMMLQLGALLIIAPQLLSNIVVALLILLFAIGLTMAIVKLTSSKS